MSRPLLIGVLGIDGSGKTTQCRLLRGFLIERGYYVEIADTGTNCRQDAHRIARKHGKESAYQLFDLEFLTTCGALEYLRYLEHKVWVEARGPRDCILFDKYAESFKAIAASRGLNDFAQVDLVLNEYPGLDLKIYLQVDMGVALSRIRKREGGFYENEKPDQLQKYHRCLDQLMSQDKDALVIDGSLPRRTVHRSIAAQVEKLLVTRCVR